METLRERVALHEAAHVAVAHRLGLPVASVSIDGGIICGGATEIDGPWNPEAADKAPFQIAVYAAGRVGEGLALAGCLPHRAEGSDVLKIRAVALRAGCAALERGFALSELIIRAELGG